MAAEGHVRHQQRGEGSGCESHANPYELEPAPIPSGWILEGSPEARGKVLACNSDEMAFTAMWDCTAGRFNWYYDIDETICVMEGLVTVRDEHGAAMTLRPGDTLLFAAGSRYEWTVPQYVRKVAFVHVPMSRKMRLARRCYHFISAIFRPRGSVAGTAVLLKGR